MFRWSNLAYKNNIIIIYSSGVEIQKLSVINNLPKLLEKNSADVNRRVVPVLRVSHMIIYVVKKNLRRLGYQRYKFEKQSPIFFRIGFAKIKHITHIVLYHRNKDSDPYFSHHFDVHFDLLQPQNL